MKRKESLRLKTLHHHSFFFFLGIKRNVVCVVVPNVMMIATSSTSHSLDPFHNVCKINHEPDSVILLRRFTRSLLRFAPTTHTSH